jgi:TRAP-type C4-dicarboxylate transport system permease large subunit
MNSAGITNRIYNFALALVGWLRGGLRTRQRHRLGIFAGMSGTAIADAAGLGTIEIKAMRDHGYSPEFSVGATAASATLGPIIPPSLPFVIYGMFANVSVGALFLAGILPGAVMALLMMATVAYFAHKNKWGGDTRFELSRIAKALSELAVVAAFPIVIWELTHNGGLSEVPTVAAALALLLLADRMFRFNAVLPIMTPVLLIGGMTAGIFTATEGAIAACLGAFLGIFWFRTLNWKMRVKVSMDTIETTSVVLLIVAAASIFGWMLTVTRTTEMIGAWVLSFTTDPWMFLLLANLLMLFVGCSSSRRRRLRFLSDPAADRAAAGIDPVHFGLVMVLNLMIGLLHPPMGLVLFALPAWRGFRSSALRWRSCPG